MPRTSQMSRWLLRGGFLLALALTLFFAVRFTLAVFYWSDPAHHDQAIEGWMPLRFVARSWDVPPEVLVDAAGLPPDLRIRRNLDLIADDQGIPVAALIAQLNAAITAFRAQSDRPAP